MMPVVRVGDINSGGGAVIQGHLNITVNGKPLAQFMSPVTPHIPCPFPPIHCGAVAAFPGSIKVTANSMPVLRVGDIDTCGHSRATGSLNVICG
tara:strand:+ start:283 stop:564 length:282 start_codon:yes stop_codon:yes gene_type:complete